MKNKSFFNMDQASMYLSSSIVRVDGLPVIINDVDYADGKTLRLHYSSLLTGQNKRIRINSNRLDINPVPLGLFKYSRDGGTAFACRAPNRGWKIGLCDRNCYLLNTYNSKDNGRFFRNKFNEVKFDKGFVNMILGSYPSLKEAVFESENTGLLTPVSRRFAVGSDKNIIYKDFSDSVGKLDDDLLPVLRNKYLYLRQSIEEDIVNAA